MLIMLFCPDCVRLRWSPLHWLAKAQGTCPRTWR